MKHPDRRLGYLVLIALLAGATPIGAQNAGLSDQQKQEFLRSAEVIAAEQTSTGITQPWRLTLTDGTVTHDALFQSVDIRKDIARLGDSRELNFVDSYRYNIAAYRLSVLLGLGGMVPVTVERDWNGTTGALSWWIQDVMFDEATRIEQRRRPDDVAAWSAQLGRVTVFGELVHDTDRNKTNMLYTRDWKLYMIDFSRAFRLWDRLQRPENLVSIDTGLFEQLATLTRPQIERALGAFLTDGEVSGVLGRRDLLIEHFEQLIDERGREVVLN